MTLTNAIIFSAIPTTISTRSFANMEASRPPAVTWHQRYGARWAPSPLLRRLAEAGTPLREAKIEGSLR
jgi:hypothetical protein